MPIVMAPWGARNHGEAGIVNVEVPSPTADIRMPVRCASGGIGT